MDLLHATTIGWLVLALGVSWGVGRLLTRRGFDVVGLEALALGLVLGPYGEQIMTAEVLAELSPALSFALGALGLSLGMRLRIDDLRARPTGALRVAVILALVTAVIVGVSLFALLDLWFPDAEVAPAALVLTAAALLATPTAIDRAVARHQASGPLTRLLREVASLSEVLGVLAFGLVLCVYHVGDASIGGGRPLVPMEWAAVGLGAGAVAGLLFGYSLGDGRTEPSEDVLGITLLGMVLFTAGVAYSLNLSPLLLCLAMGAAATHATRAGDAIRSFVRPLEAPLIAVVVFFAASAWRMPDGWEPWALVVAYLAIRAVARVIGGRVAAMSLAPDDRDGPVARSGGALVGQGALVVAIAVNAWQVYDDALTTTVLTCLLLGGFLNEIPSQRAVRNALIDADEVPESPALASPPATSSAAEAELEGA